MWQAPALTIVGQAFIPGVLTDRSVGWAIASVVSVAGVLASVAVAVAAARPRGAAERADRDRGEGPGLARPAAAGPARRARYAGSLLHSSVGVASPMALDRDDRSARRGGCCGAHPHPSLSALRRGLVLVARRDREFGTGDSLHGVDELIAASVEDDALLVDRAPVSFASFALCWTATGESPRGSILYRPAAR